MSGDEVNTSVCHSQSEMSYEHGSNSQWLWRCAYL